MDITAILQQRDRQSFDWLYNRYAGMLFGLIRKMVEENTIAETLLLETYVEAWKSLDEFDGKSSDVLIRLVRIARVKADNYNRHSGQQDQHRDEHKKEFGTSSFHQRPSGQKQYSIQKKIGAP